VLRGAWGCLGVLGGADSTSNASEMTIFNNTHVASESINYNKNGERSTIEISLVFRSTSKNNIQQSTIQWQQQKRQQREQRKGRLPLLGEPTKPRCTLKHFQIFLPVYYNKIS